MAILTVNNKILWSKLTELAENCLLDGKTNTDGASFYWIDGDLFVDETDIDVTAFETAINAVDVETEYNAVAYQWEREKEYPSIGEQLDMIFHAIDSGTLDKTSDFYTTIKSVKDDFPKPE